jgi:1-deoxy-D-xylulose-5-phosphate synthase
VFTTLLENVNDPKDISQLSITELETLASEIRAFLVESVSKTGGHFGANLGVVELTLAMHKIYNSPYDKFIWDVGHQSYVHKLLTGRKDLFSSLRKHKGMAGFPRRHESEHDAFGAGHASTSISAGLGMAVARDLSHESYRVVCVIGDGALTGGMAMEAMNHAGHLGTDLTVILNDNEMSIAENVGAMSKYLTRLRTDPSYSRAKAELESLLKKLPAIGSKLTKGLERVKDSMRNFVLPGQFFEAFGFKYIGPIDGHDLPTVLRVLEDAKRLRGPVLIHLITRKGKGYASAEAAPDKFHAWPSAAKEKAAPAYTSVFCDALMQLAKQDDRIVAVTPAMVPGSGLTAFGKAFPNRLFDVGIAEQHAATFCAGLAAVGKRPVLAIYSTFMQRAYDQVIHDICIQNLPVTFAVDRAGLVGPDGETHQGAFDIAYLRTVPNMTLMAPRDENELKRMMKTGIELGTPAAVRYPRADGIGVTMDDEITAIPVGKADVISTGKDCVFLALGSMVSVAERAAEQLSLRHGISAGVVNMRFVKPIDADLIRSLAERGIPLITVEEGSLMGGFGSAVLETLADAQMTVPVLRLGLPDRFIEHGGRGELLEDIGLSESGVATDTRRFLVKLPDHVKAWS